MLRLRSVRLIIGEAEHRVRHPAPEPLVVHELLEQLGIVVEHGGLYLASITIAPMASTPWMPGHFRRPKSYLAFRSVGVVTVPPMLS